MRFCRKPGISKLDSLLSKIANTYYKTIPFATEWLQMTDSSPGKKKSGLYPDLKNKEANKSINTVEHE